jgi:hypothetical protein
MKGARLCSEKEKAGCSGVPDCARKRPLASAARAIGGQGSGRPTGAALTLAVSSALLAPSLLAVGCGASIQAVYEGDVRFEHCMALDAKPEGRDAIRRACWTEWVEFYTYGQTRDRVRYAEQRIVQLGGTAGTAGMADGGLADDPLQAPAPRTGLLAPPAEAGAPEGGPPPPSPGITGAAIDAGAPNEELARCREDCHAARDECERPCRSARCRKACAANLPSCLAACGP